MVAAILKTPHAIISGKYTWHKMHLSQENSISTKARVTHKVVLLGIWHSPACRKRHISEW